MSLPAGYESTFVDTDEIPVGDGATVSPGSPPPLRQAFTVRASEVRREAVEWLEPGRVPLGLVTVLAGIAGLGKSSWACLLAARLSRGELLAGPGATVIATAEDSLATTVKPRLEAVQADLGLVEFLKIRTEDGVEDGLSIPDDLPELERIVAESSARLVVVDPLVAHLPSEIDAHKDQHVRRALAPLYRLAETHRCAVVALLHLNKANGLSPLARISGSGGFGNAARSVLLLDRDPEDPGGEEGHQRVLAHVKCNVGPLAPSLLYRVAPIVLPATVEEPQMETGRLELLGESKHNGRELLSVPSEEERGAIDEAEEFLRGELPADGTRRLAEEVLKAARKLGISEPTLRRARKRLGVETKKGGLRPGWEWSLETDSPKASSPLTPSEASERDAFGETAQPCDIPAATSPEGVSHRTVTPSGNSTPSPASYPQADESRFCESCTTERECAEQRCCRWIEDEAAEAQRVLWSENGREPATNERSEP
jgi:hypothetical protein